MTYSSTQRTRRQRQRREDKLVKRFEIVLSSNDQRDHTLHGFLTDLPRGEVSQFIKSAIEEKIQRCTAPLTAPGDPADQLNTILKELAALRSAVTIPAAGYALTGHPAPAIIPQRPEPALVVASSGLDLSGPRRKREGSLSLPKPATLPEQVFDPAACRQKLLDSINAHGTLHSREKV